jgi:hypothetical protein
MTSLLNLYSQARNFFIIIIVIVVKINVANGIGFNGRFYSKWESAFAKASALSERGVTEQGNSVGCLMGHHQPRFSVLLNKKQRLTR